MLPAINFAENKSALEFQDTLKPFIFSGEGYPTLESMSWVKKNLGNISQQIECLHGLVDFLHNQPHASSKL